MYQPSDDSYFFKEFLEKHLPTKKKIKFLDMGSGSGILAETAKKMGHEVLAADINPKAIAHIKKKGIGVIHSDLFSNIKEKFDLIVFNAPYLPRDKNEPKDSQLETTGGKEGDEISLKFIKQALKHLNPKGKIFLLVSSLTPLNRLKKFKPKLVARKKIWIEELLIFQFTPKN